jgi:hypothetical protein
MARKTIRIEIPVGSPDDLITLSEGITEKNSALGASAVLDNDKMVQLAGKTSSAKAKRKEAAELSARAKTLNDQADALLGIAPGQNATTEGTVLFHITGARDALMVEHRGNEEALGEYSFVVITGTAKTPGARKKKTA